MLTYVPFAVQAKPHLRFKAPGVLVDQGSLPDVYGFIFLHISSVENAVNHLLVPLLLLPQKSQPFGSPLLTRQLLDEVLLVILLTIVGVQCWGGHRIQLGLVLQVVEFRAVDWTNCFIDILVLFWIQWLNILLVPFWVNLVHCFLEWVLEIHCEVTRYNAQVLTGHKSAFEIIIKAPGLLTGFLISFVWEVDILGLVFSLCHEIIIIILILTRYANIRTPNHFSILDGFFTGSSVVWVGLQDKGTLILDENSFGGFLREQLIDWFWVVHRELVSVSAWIFVSIKLEVLHTNYVLEDFVFRSDCVPSGLCATYRSIHIHQIIRISIRIVKHIDNLGFVRISQSIRSRWILSICLWLNCIWVPLSFIVILRGLKIIIFIYIFVWFCQLKLFLFVYFHDVLLITGFTYHGVLISHGDLHGMAARWNSI